MPGIGRLSGKNSNKSRNIAGQASSLVLRRGGATFGSKERPVHLARRAVKMTVRCFSLASLADWVLNQKLLAARGDKTGGIKLPAETLKGLEHAAFCVRGPPAAAAVEKKGNGRRRRRSKTERKIDSVSYPFLFLPYLNFVQQWSNNVGMGKEREDRKCSLCVPDPTQRRRRQRQHKKGRRYTTAKQCSSRLVGQFGFDTGRATILFIFVKENQRIICRVL